MELKYRITGGARRVFAEAVSEILGMGVVYQGTPSFAFAVGDYVIDRYGNLHCPISGSVGNGNSNDNNDGGSVYGEELFRLIAALKERGYVAENEPQPPEPPRQAKQPSNKTKWADTSDIAMLVIELPQKGLNADKLDNVSRIIQSKAILIRAAIGDNLVSAAHDLPVRLADGKIRFPWFSPGARPEEIKAYSHLLIKICEMAEKQKYVVAQEREVENQKYAFRCFLLRLGFIGTEYGETRKILLANLTGNGSFKSGQHREAIAIITNEANSGSMVGINTSLALAVGTLGNGGDNSGKV
jgi:hypothetical protein